MPRDYKLYLEDILTAIEKIERFTNGISFEEFSARDLYVDAVLHNLEIIGEAAKHIPENLRLQARKIEWRKVAGLRDIVAHQYFGVSLQIIWDIIQNQIPSLKQEVARLLQETDWQDNL